PFTALIYAILLQGLRHLRSKGATGVALVRAVPVICVVMIAARAAAGPFHLAVQTQVPTWCSQWLPQLRLPDQSREVLIANLKGIGQRHLVIVRYAPDH